MKEQKPLHPGEISQYTTLSLDKIFLRFQLDVIESNYIAELIQKGRQEGISWALAYKAKRITGDEGREDTFVATKTKLLAKQFVQDAAAWAKLFRVIKSTVDAVFESEVSAENPDTGQTEKVSTYGIKFPNRREVVALSSNADAMRGWRGYKIADEFALHKQQKEVLDSLLPSRQWKKPFTICSTHKGKNSEFNKLIVKYKKGLLDKSTWTLHTIPITRAVEDGMLEKIEGRPFSAEERRAWLENLEREEGIRRWNQEYMCIPEDEEGSFFTFDQISQCEYDEALFFPEDGVKKFAGAGQELEALAWFKKIAFAADTLGTGNFYLGMDVGRNVNYTVLCLIEVVAGIRFVRAIAALDNFCYPAQQDCASTWIRIRTFRRCCMDNRGIGNETGERLQKRHGTYVVERIDATARIKEQFAYAVLGLMLDKLLRYPSDDTVRDDFHSIQKVDTVAGNTRIVASKNETDENSHGDYYTAISLGVHACDNPVPDIVDSIHVPGTTAITGIGQPGESFDRRAMTESM